MIRVFQLFFKLNFKKLNAFDFFTSSMSEINIHNFDCPICHSKYPDWKRHDDYERQLISFENGKIVCFYVIIIRYKCYSCGHTHAILPESIIPYQSHSLIFILAVLSDYFTKSLSVQSICDKYGISASTLYSWKNLFLKHKKSWLGVLKDADTSSVQFLDFLFSDFLFCLSEFFQISKMSFLQSVTNRRKARSAPV